VAEDLELGENESEEEFDFPPPERKIITQPYDLSVSALVGSGARRHSFFPRFSGSTSGTTPEQAGSSSRSY